MVWYYYILLTFFSVTLLREVPDVDLSKIADVLEEVRIQTRKLLNLTLN